MLRPQRASASREETLAQRTDPPDDGDDEPEGGSLVRWLTWLLLVGCVLFLAIRSAGNARWDWDVLAYAGCVEELKGATPAEVHHAAYAQLGEYAPPEANDDLRHRIEYRRRLENDPEAFAAQLPFYRGRVLPIALLAALDRVGVPSMRGIFAISFASGVILALVFALWVARYVRFTPFVLACVPWLWLCGWSDTLAMATADALAALLVVGGALLLLETRHLVVALVLLGLSMATRADHLLLVGPVLLLRYLLPARERHYSGRALLVTLSLYLGVVLLCTLGRGTYGWWIVFHHTFVGYELDPLGQTPPRDLGFWLSHTLRSLPMFREWPPLVTTLAAAAAIGVGFRKHRWRSRGAGLAAAATLGVGAHFLLFPALWPRLFLAYWLLIGIALVIAARERADEEVHAVSGRSGT